MCRGVAVLAEGGLRDEHVHLGRSNESDGQDQRIGDGLIRLPFGIIDMIGGIEFASRIISP